MRHGTKYMTNPKEMLSALSPLMSVSGFERRDRDRLLSLVTPYFDEYREDAVGNYFFIKKSGLENAPLMLIDTHYDEIGMLVIDIKEGGFLSVTNVGGLDTRIMQAAEVTIYGEKTIFGVVSSTPPHLQDPKETKKLKKVSELLIDTGYSKTELEKIVSVGTPVGFYPRITELDTGYLVGKGFDNKACVAAAVCAMSELDADKLKYNVCLLLSAKEEIGLKGGRVGAYNADPDYAVVLDVNLASAPDTKKHKTVKPGAGPSVSLSAVTDRKLTRHIINTAVKKEIPHQTVVETTSTGTNADIIALSRRGIPTAVVSIPLKGMHTYTEAVCIKDMEQTAAILREILTTEVPADE